MKMVRHWQELATAAVATVLLYTTSSTTTIAQSVNTAAFVSDCTRVCGTFETCVLYDNAEICAPYCAPGRCNDATEVCIIQAQHCATTPCLPIAVCELKSSQTLALTTSLSEEIINSPIAAACARQCPMVSAPVCGSNGVSYVNQCFFEQAQCASPGLVIAYAQLCAEDAATNAQYNPADIAATGNPVCDAIKCSTVEDPVCTSQGTMRNFCYWTRAQCASPSTSLLTRTACPSSSSSEQMAACPMSCTHEFVPVCGSNGVLYGNECLFRQANCERQRLAGAVSTTWAVRAVDLSYCELQVGDSQGMASDAAATTLLATTK